MDESNKVPEVNIEIFGERYEGKFGYKVYATKEEERDYVLYCVARKIRSGKNKGKYRVWEEVRGPDDNLLQKSRRKAIIDDAERAGSFCFFHAKKDLCDKLAYHMIGTKRIEDLLRKKQTI